MMITTILAALHPADKKHLVLSQAVEIVQSFKATLHIICVCDLAQHWEVALPDVTPEVIASLKTDSDHFLIRVRAYLKARGVSAQFHREDGVAAEQIILLATDIKADLILTGHRHLSWLHRLFETSIGEALIDNAPCSILIATEKNSAEEDST